jgi:hypothetical protein
MSCPLSFGFIKMSVVLFIVVAIIAKYGHWFHERSIVMLFEPSRSISIRYIESQIFHSVVNGLECDSLEHGISGMVWGRVLKD